MARFAFLALLTVALVGCTPSNQLVVTDTMNGQTIVLTPGQNLVVRLPSSASSGSRWTVLEPNDPTVLRLLNWQYEQPGHPGQPGTGTEVWQFQAVKEGSTGVKLGYSRLYAADAPEKEFSVTIQVQAKK